jgi:DNA polymerase-3 subunit alpha
MNAPARNLAPAAPAAPPAIAAESAVPVLPKFIHLKVHSAYSLLEGALPIGTLAKLADKHAFPALALTDTNNMFGVLEAANKLADSGIQPIAGISLAIDCQAKKAERRNPGGAPVRPQPHKDGLIALYAMNDEGYANLMQLVSKAHLESPDVEGPHIKLADLEQRAAGIIALTGGPDGPIDRALRDGQDQVAEARLKTFARIFGDRLYVEVQRHGTREEAAVEPRLLDLAYRHALPIVATNEAYFASPDDYEAHDALICIAEGKYIVEDDRRRLTREHYFKSAAEMAELFADLPEALANTVEIARRCAWRVKGKKPMLPRFVDGRAAIAGVAEAGLGECGVGADEIEAAELKRHAEEGLDARLAVVPLADGFTREDYDKRLAYEVDIIARMKFPGYFLIVADFIKWSKANGVPVGPGRGSGAGSLVAWALTITDLDPLRFGLLFERFLNPERVSMPDFDIDFCQDKRERTIRYVQEKYGRDRVAQIITHGKLQARAVLRDVGRVLQMPFGQVSKLCGLVPNNPANPVTLEDAIESEPKLQDERDNDPMVARLLEISLKLEGLYRHASTHAAGMVIGDRPLAELVPMYRDPKSDMPVTQFNWKFVEAAGLVKFDFLGLKTLTVLQKAVDLIKKGRGIDVDLSRVSIENNYPEANRAYELLARADTVGVFQLESTGMRDSLKKLKPDRFEDIIAMVALYRPGPMDNIPTYINRKHGEEPVDCLHPMLEGILKETYGVIIYQEQVMQIAQVMAGYSLGQADLLRRAMGKKDKNEMAKQQALFVEGAMKRGVKKDDAVYIFELVDKFAGYGFNKSHAAAYALVSYHTAYLKANFREEFLAASMTLELANTDKLAGFAAEARKSAIEVKQPCINSSEVEFGAVPGTPERPGAIVYALAALKNIGAAAMETVVAEREARGAFKDLADFAGRIDPKVLNKRAIEMLASAGAFDTLEPSRALVHANADVILSEAGKRGADKAIGQFDMLSAMSSDAKKQGVVLKLRPARQWTPMERLDMEFSAVGYFLSGHPLDEYESALASMGVKRYADFAAEVTSSGSARIAAIVVSARERRSAKGNKFAFGMFSDASGQFEAIIFGDTLSASRDLLEAGTPVLLAVGADRVDAETLKLRVDGIQALDAVIGNVDTRLRVTFNPGALSAQRIGPAFAELRSHLKPGRGEIRLVIPLPEEAREVELALPGRYDVSPASRGLLSTVPGVVAVMEA